ncbi:MAG: hypothetical protein WEA09_08595 [Gemmatimonadota bacterium]
MIHAHHPDKSRQGFTLAVVVFLLFAIGVAAATGFQVAASEQAMAMHSSDGARARAVAEAGLGLFVGEHVGMVVPTDTVYNLDGGTATITAWRVSDVAAWDPVYAISSRGEVLDPRFASAPAVRVVREFHALRRVPIVPLGAFTHSGWVISQGADVSGHDEASPGECFGAGASIAGIAVGTGFFNLGGSISGSPNVWNLGSQANLWNALEMIPWTALIHPEFPVDYENPAAWPTPLPGVYPSIRWNGNLAATQARSGRGVLIVDGFLNLQDDFEWDGVILARGMYSPASSIDFEIEGMLVVGLAGAPSATWLRSGEIEYNSCQVRAAMQRLAYFQPVASSWWEAL